MSPDRGSPCSSTPEPTRRRRGRRGRRRRGGERAGPQRAGPGGRGHAPRTSRRAGPTGPPTRRCWSSPRGSSQLAGFDVAAVSVVRDSQHMQVMAVAGNDEARDILLGTFTPITRLMEELEHAEDWGMFQFVPHESLDPESESWGWVPDLEPARRPRRLASDGPAGRPALRPQRRAARHPVDRLPDRRAPARRGAPPDPEPVRRAGRPGAVHRRRARGASPSRSGCSRRPATWCATPPGSATSA